MVANTAAITELMRRTELVIASAENRYRITVQVAMRAKRRYYDENREDDEDPAMKPVVQAIYEFSDEVLAPDFIAD
jgi:DNA-directed RNA polymerase subunit omega